MLKNIRGFKHIKLLVVIAIIAILAGVVFWAINPRRRLAEANNAQRWTDVTGVVNAISAYIVDNDGTYPSDIDTTYGSAQMLGTAGSACTACTATTTVSACVDLTQELVNEGYLPSIPFDPSSGSASMSDYYIQREATGIITIGACDPEAEGDTIPTVKVQK